MTWLSRAKWSRMLGGLVWGVLLLPLPAVATVTLTWTNGPSSQPSLISASVDPSDSSTVIFALDPGGSSTAQTFTITGTADATATGNTINAQYVGWGALHLTSGTVTFQATYNNQVFWNPDQKYVGVPPDNQFTGIGHGVNNVQPRSVTFTITFQDAIWTVNSTPTRLNFFDQ